MSAFILKKSHVNWTEAFGSRDLNGVLVRWFTSNHGEGRGVGFAAFCKYTVQSSMYIPLILVH